MADITRRGFLQTVALAGLTRKSGGAIAGGFVHESQTIGHRLRDGAAFPAPRDERRVSIVIVGGGIAGLSAAWRLQKLGLTDLALLEMDPEAGGNGDQGASHTRLSSSRVVGAVRIPALDPGCRPHWSP